MVSLARSLSPTPRTIYTFSLGFSPLKVNKKRKNKKRLTWVWSAAAPWFWAGSQWPEGTHMCVLSQKGLHRPCFTATSAQTPGFTHMARQMCLAYVQGWKMKNYGSEGPRALKWGGGRRREGGNFSSAEKSSCGCEAGGRRLTGGRAASSSSCGACS